MGKPTQKTVEQEISVLEVSQGRVEFCVLGSTPLILNRMSEKAKRELLLPKGKKSAADKAASLKHNPMEEYRASANKAAGADAPTRLLIPSTAFKGAIRDVALDVPGEAKKAQIGRLTYVPGDYVNVYGIPKLFMCIARMQDMARTPDVRTRAIVPEWACRLTVTYIRPILKEQSVANLLAAAGIMRGVGDWRPEKGKGDYGQFELVGKDDPRFLRIVKAGGRVQQDKALETPEPYDAETAELLTWFSEEAGRRGFKVVA